ncbi:hypothetical protein BpHYR1_030852 [Brachionus plicatilis]|uniref:Uncharacterized protein n=1 Tax=Brachionus plicatilis TaxID=10195 RepID=A0A3M7Q2Z2_BRAPC|nr:hypothetical protein BpHYR1_030852 [Brachionus plicatilis]
MDSAGEEGRNYFKIRLVNFALQYIYSTFVVNIWHSFLNEERNRKSRGIEMNKLVLNYAIMVYKL